jgi:glucokinase
MPGRRIIGVDVGGSKLLAGAVDTDFFVHRRVQRSVAGLDQASLITVITESVNETREASGGVVEAVGLGIPGRVDTRSGRSSLSANLPLRDVLAERTGLPVVVDNDGNLAALAEHRAGAAQGADHALMLTVGAGIGGGLIINGELYRGATGLAGELGHITIDLDGGSLERLASGTALVSEATKLAGRRPNSALARAQSVDEALVIELAHDGDAAAREAIALIGTRLGVGIASLINALNPQVVVIGGTVVGAGELLLGPARAEVARRALAPAREAVSIVGAHFGIEAGMIGAAVLAHDSLTSGRAR